MTQQQDTAEAQGLLLIGHGSRQPEGVAPMADLADLIARRVAPCPVAVSFLEFAQPSISEGVSELVSRGARRIIAAPVILFAAGHIRRDIPDALGTAVAAQPGVEIRLTPHLGTHSALIELSEYREREALSSAPASFPDRTALVLVGRGSNDADATAEIREFVSLRRARSDLAIVREAFVSMAEPSLPNVLAELERPGVEHLIVQPHFLFGGVLVDRIRQMVLEASERNPTRQYTLCAPLGVDERLVSAILDRVGILPVAK